MLQIEREETCRNWYRGSLDVEKIFRCIFLSCHDDDGRDEREVVKVDFIGASIKSDIIAVVKEIVNEIKTEYFLIDMS